MISMKTVRRKFAALLALAALASLISSCQATAMSNPPPTNETQKRFKGIGLTLVTDAVEGAEMLGTQFFADDQEFPFFGQARLVKTNRSIMSFPASNIPQKVRVIWRDNSVALAYPNGRSGITYGGKLLGDYTLPIASRIPDAVLQEIRKNGGGLRLKFRLKPDGVMFGWDIERFSGGLPRHSMPGGDFLETWY